MISFLRKTSYLSGIILLIAPIFSTFFINSGLRIESFYSGFKQGVIGLEFISFAIVIILLELMYFIKLFKAYKLGESHAYYIIYILGVFASIGIIYPVLAEWSLDRFYGWSLELALLRPLPYIMALFIPFFLYALFSYRYQRERFFQQENYLIVRKDTSMILGISFIVAVIGLVINARFLELSPIGSSAMISALLIAPFIYWWRKKAGSTLRSFLFLPALQVVVVGLVIKLAVWWNILDFLLR